MIKKYIIAIFIILLVNIPVFAEQYTPEKYCTPAFDVSSKTNQVVSKMFGATFVAEKLGESIIRKQIKKETGQKFKVSLKSYSLSDLKRGIFKSLKITGKNIDIDGIKVSLFEAKTLCDFNYFDLSSDEIYNKSNVLMDYSLIITESDLKNTVDSKDYNAILQKVDLNALGIKLIKLESVDVAIKNERLHVMLNVSSGITNLFNKASNLKFEVSTALKVVDGKINTYDVRLENSNRQLNIAKYLSLINFIDPLQYSLDAFAVKNGKLLINSTNIVDDKILVEGIIFIPKK
ncbi:hypothetical protein IJ818_04090 [bacterium]|nr:hypothetical protein [bacterium]